MVRTTRRLAPGEGLTVVAELPSAAVDPPSEAQLLWYRLYDNRAWIFGRLGLLARARLLFRRLAKRSDAIPRAALSSRCFIRRRTFRRRLPTTSTIGVSAATGGAPSRRPPCRSRCAAFYASMTASGTLTLKAIGKEAPGRLPVGERVVLDWVNGQGGLAIISNAHGESIAKVGDKFTKSIELENRNRFFRRNLGYVLAGLAITAAVIGGVLAFGGLQDKDIGGPRRLCVFRLHRWNVPNSGGPDRFFRARASMH